ncbi:hypothetical protein C8C83_5038 [Flavobacterium sp. 90]|uniref:hypothetical protein n=1 Tax=unclassified Flavobacterium TaxID=196869 RepID=UPI000EB3AEE2|nr:MULTISPECIES: hypothetical protein [unclassified Flavobacterium]RKR05687.1 hypothetical protein C8C82_5382 [Flavobacterium sp. 81]TCK57000.1 hypothetical protein C8C83_5038 [Flavobacterium sp. 90]
MKTIKNQLAVILLSIITLSSCKNDEKSANNKANTTIKKDSTKIDTSLKMSTIFSIANSDNSEIIKISGNEDTATDDDKFLFSGDKITLIVSKFKKNKEILKLIQADTLLKIEYCMVNIDPQLFLRKKIQDVDYFLFAVMKSPMGNGDHSLYLSFIMLNMNTLKFYTLEYIGENTVRSRETETVDGAFEESKTLDSNPEIKKELYEFANQSKWIYKPTGKEKDINYYTNFEQKWYSDNASKNGKSPDIITSTYYSEDLFKFNGEYDKDQVTENESFKIVTYFRNNVIAYDKNKKLYFPIIVESCAHGCAKTIEFVSENEIEVTYEMDVQEPYTIDLNTIKFLNNPL